ncbi:MAG: alpha/beta fold hydrolase [Acidisphaera sp.]|nr:alpha/beta fold hydrolase [Acidisphaera sp.]
MAAIPGPESRTFTGRGDVALRYQIEGAGPLVGLIHGVGANLESWDEIAHRLAGQFTVLRADLRGHGRSGRIAQCSIADFVADVTDLLDTLGAASTHLVGFSLGGLIAQHVALAHPGRVRRLALISSVADRTPEERARVLQRADILRDSGIASVVQAAQDRWFTPAFKAANPDKVERRLRELVANDHRSYAAAYRVFAQADAGLRVETIASPTLIMTGEHDQGSTPRMARYLHERIRGSELHILPDLRHSVLLERPDLIARLLLEFLTRTERPKATG